MFFTDRNKSIEEVLSVSRAPATVSKYNRAVSAWKNWCAAHKVRAIPAEPQDVANYYMSQYNNGAPYSRIETAHYSLKWFHDCSPLTINNPCDSKFIRLLLAGLKRILAKPKNKKNPITPDILSKIILKFGDSNVLSDVRLCAYDADVLCRVLQTLRID